MRIQANETELSEDLLTEFASDNDSRDIAEKILAALSAEDRELLEMQFYKDMSLKDISNKRNVSYASLQRHNYRLLKKIKKISEKNKIF